jgi:hypothetical protein
MIHKKMAYRAGSGKTLRYIYRGDGHEHQLTGLSHISSQMISKSPILRDRKTKKIMEVDTDFIEAEFDFLAHKNKRSKKKMAHYVISLSPSEKLTNSQWALAATFYMKKMGYGMTTKWTAALHDEKDNQHMHIVACRVQNSSALKYSLVSDKSDYLEGMKVMRKLEKNFELAVTQSPRETWGKDIPKDQFEMIIKDYKDKKVTDEEVELPWAQRVIARLSQAVEKSKGKTFTDFLGACEKVGVQPLITRNESGFPLGISYAFEGRSESGYRLKSSRLTFTALTGQRYCNKLGEMIKQTDQNEGIHYEQERDIQACNRTSRTERAQRSTQASFIPAQKRGFRTSGLSPA